MPIIERRILLRQAKMFGNCRQDFAFAMWVRIFLIDIALGEKTHHIGIQIV